jgi:hypothetical protein
VNESVDCDYVPSPDLNRCDLFSIDGERVEKATLEEIKPTPMMVIVETHAANGAPDETITDILENDKYSILLRLRQSDVNYLHSGPVDSSSTPEICTSIKIYNSPIIFDIFRSIATVLHLCMRS